MIVDFVLTNILAAGPLGDIELTHSTQLRQRIKVVSKLVAGQFYRATVWLCEPEARKYRMKAVPRPATKSRVDLTDCHCLQHATIGTSLGTKLISSYHEQGLAVLETRRVVEDRESAR